MSTSINKSFDYQNQLTVIPISKSLLCLRGLRDRKSRFEVEYGLERGSTHNSFLFIPTQNSENKNSILIHPPGAFFTNSFIDSLNKHIPQSTEKLLIALGHINPNRLDFLKKIVNVYSNIEILCSSPCAKILKELWQQQKLSEKNNIKPTLDSIPNIRVIRDPIILAAGDNHHIKLIPTPSARWPGSLVVFEENEGILMSEKIFGAHLCTKNWAEINRSATEEERRHYFDCLIAPMTSQIDSLIEKFDELDIRTIAPTHGPAIENSWRSLLNDYRQWGEIKNESPTKVILIYASAYGNTASIADALAKGITRTGIRVESFNCEFTSSNELTKAIQTADAYLIGSPTLGGHAPTPIISALGTLLAEGNRKNPIGIFGSYGWSGEALDLLEKKLYDGGFSFGFDPIKIKFSPNRKALKTLEETGTIFGRELLKDKKRNIRRITNNISTSRDDPALLALGRIIGCLCVLTTQKITNEEPLNGAMIASWVSQASFSPPGISVAVAKDRAVESLLHVGDFFILNVLASGKEQKQMKQFLKPFAPGENRLQGVDITISQNNQPILGETMTWLECCVKQRMECGDHWVIYAEVSHGKVLDKDSVTAIHHRRTGATY